MHPRQMFFLVLCIVTCILGAVLSFHHFGSVSIADLIGIAFIATGCLAASFLPPGAP